jgi:outer membrane biosynthesis protein TonB
MDLLHDLLMVFDMSQTDPWVAFYGKPEPEPDPIPEPKIVKPEPKQEVKPVGKKPEPVKESKPTPKSEEKKPEKAKEEAPLPGQIEIKDFPETVPEQLEEDEEENDSWQQDSKDHSEEPITNEPEEQFEIVEADIVHSQNEEPNYDINVKYDTETGEVEVHLDASKGIRLIRVIDTGTGESWEVTINQ